MAGGGTGGCRRKEVEIDRWIDRRGAVKASGQESLTARDAAV